MTEFPSPSDPGLQPERTALAWVRTALSVPIATLVMIRFSAHYSLVAALVFAVTAFPLSIAAVLLAWRRSAHSAHTFHRDTPLPDATLPALLTVVVILLGAAAIGYVLFH